MTTTRPRQRTTANGTVLVSDWLLGVHYESPRPLFSRSRSRVTRSLLMNPRRTETAKRLFKYTETF